MADAITIQELIDARTDAKTLEEAVNGDAVTTVLSRLGETYPTLSNALSQIDGKLDSADAQIKQAITDLFQNGGLPATPFATKALMTASALVDGDYAMVTDDTDNNGLYIKTAGAWVKSTYDPLTQAKSYTNDEIAKTVLKTDKGIANGVATLDSTGKVPTAQLPIKSNLLNLVSKLNFQDAIAKGAVNGDVYINSANGLLYTIENIRPNGSGGTTADSIETAYTSNQVFLYQNELFVYRNNVFVNINKNADDIQTTYNVDVIGDFKYALSVGAKVGDIYFQENTGAFLREILTISGSTGTTKNIPIFENQIFIHNDELYVYSEGYLKRVSVKNTITDINVVKLASMTSIEDAISNGAQVGDNFYNSTTKKVYKIATISGSTGTTTNIAYNKSQMFLFNGEFYIKGVTELELTDKYSYIKLYSMSSDTHAVQNGAQVDDYYYRETNRVLYKYYQITSATTGKANPVPITYNMVFEFSGRFYVYDGYTLVDANRQYDIADVRIPHVMTIGTFADALVAKAKVGDYFYDPAYPVLIFSIRAIYSASEGEYVGVPLVKGQAVSIKNEIYVFDGTQLVNTTANVTSLLGGKGNKKLVEPPADSVMSAYINGIKFSDELQAPITELTKAGDRFAHTPSFVIHDDTVYSIFMVNYVGTGEKPTQLNIRLQYFALSDPTNITYLDVCNLGDVHQGKAVTSNYDSFVFIKDGVLTLLWDAILEGDEHYTVLYRTFDTATKTLSAGSDVVQIKVGDVVKPMTGVGINSAFVDAGIDMPNFQQHVVLMPHVTTRVEGGVTYYYTGMGAKTRYNAIVKTSDFITWEYVSHPSFTNMAWYEPAVYVIGNIAYYFSRQQYSSAGFLTRYDLVNDTWESPTYIDEVASRSELFMFNSKLYLAHAPIDRNHIALVEINQTRLEDSRTVQVSVNPSEYSYPTVQVYDGELYMLYSDTKLKIFLSKFTIESISPLAIKNVFKTLFSL